MRRVRFFLYAIVIHTVTFAQITLPADRNKKASVTEYVGITMIKVDYSRPILNGREGKIWGGVVHNGFADLHYGTSKAAPWRAGANENTTIEFTTNVKVEGQDLAAGKYGFFVAMAADHATLIFSKYNTAWGSFYYDSKDDVLRVNVTLQKLPSTVQRLKYEFDESTESSIVLSLNWEKMRIPFKITVDEKATQVEAFRREFNSGMFYRYWQNMQTAANYCLVNDINLEEALIWADRSINTYFGETNFLTLTTYAGLLKKLNRSLEADSIMAKAIPLGTTLQLVIFASNLNKMKLHKEAYQIFKTAHDKDPDSDYANLGMVRANYFIGNVKEAIAAAERGRKITENPARKKEFESYIEDLKAGKEMFK